MKRFLTILFVSLFTFGLMAPASAATGTNVIVPLEELDDMTRNKVIKKIKIKQLNDKGKPITTEVKYIKRYEFKDSACRSVSAACHALAFIALNITTISLLVG